MTSRSDRACSETAFTTSRSVTLGAMVEPPLPSERNFDTNAYPRPSPWFPPDHVPRSPGNVDMPANMPSDRHPAADRPRDAMPELRHPLSHPTAPEPPTDM